MADMTSFASAGPRARPERTSEELRSRREARRRAVQRRRLLALVGMGAVAVAVVTPLALLRGGAGTPPASASSEAPRSTAGLGPGLSDEELREARVSFAAVGDMAFNKDSTLPADGRVYFKRLKGALSAPDVTLGNLEGTLATGGTSKCGSGSPNCFAFRAPPRYARALAASGFDVANTANNHAFDYGATGRRQTLRALRRAGVRPTGAGTGPTLFKVGDVRVAVLGFAPQMPGWNVVKISKAVARVRYAAERADIVVVTMHAGAEGVGARHVGSATEWFLGENRGNVKRFSHAVVNAGADLVVGHGPHVLRGMEWWKGRLIAYSMGNFAGHASLNWKGLLGVSGVLRVTLRGDGTWITGRLVPVRTRGIPSRDRSGAALDAVRSLSRADFGARGARIRPDGEIRART